MTKVMTPSDDKPITKGQIQKLQDLLGVALRESGLPSSPSQKVIETQGSQLIANFVAAIRTAVEMISNLIIRTVHVDRTRTPQEVLNATGRVQYTDKKVVDVMPRGEGEQVEFHFFKPDPYAYKDGWISDDEVERQFDLRGLKPDWEAQAEANRADPAFADKHPNGTHFKDPDGNWCFVTFSGWIGGRDVDVDRNNSRGWDDRWWFGGVSK